MPDVTESYGKFFDLIAFFRYFHTLLTSIHVWSIVSSPNFHRLCLFNIQKCLKKNRRIFHAFTETLKSLKTHNIYYNNISKIRRKYC